MDNTHFKNRLWAFVSLIILGLSYCFCRFAMFDFHGMKEYPTILFIVSLILLIISLILKKHLLSITTILGYITGFVIALIFNSDSINSAGARTNNLWILWTVILLLCIVIGFCIEMVASRKKLNK